MPERWVPGRAQTTLGSTMLKPEPHSSPRNYFSCKAWVGGPALSMADKPIVEGIYYFIFPRALSPGHCLSPTLSTTFPQDLPSLPASSYNQLVGWELEPRRGQLWSQEWPLSSWYNHDLKKSTPVTAMFPATWSKLIHHKRGKLTLPEEPNGRTVVLLAVVHQAQQPHSPSCGCLTLFAWIPCAKTLLSLVTSSWVSVTFNQTTAFMLLVSNRSSISANYVFSCSLQIWIHSKISAEYLACVSPSYN